MNQLCGAISRLYYLQLAGQDKRACLMKTFVVMKMIFFLSFVLSLGAWANSFGQKISLDTKDASFKSVIQQVQRQSGYSFIIKDEYFKQAKPISLSVKESELFDLLPLIFKGQPFDFEVSGKIVSAVAFSNTNSAGKVIHDREQAHVRGQVIHGETQIAIDGATVRVKGTDIVVTTNAQGRFQLPLSTISRGTILVFSYVGMRTVEEPFDGQSNWLVQLVPNSDAIKDVVVTGIYQRDRESFTGSSSTYTIKELQMVGNQNLLQSLKTLDPSFAIVDNNLFGSDPNRLPDIEIRGKSSVIGLTDEYSSNPNQPLFILDGFESTLAIISDLSMDRVESITLLKDAAAAAIYGSKAANGVVVVETKRPEPGKLRINYTLSGNVSFADLTDYNLMNAQEKLQFELLSGFYGIPNSDGHLVPGSNLNNEALYYNRLKEVGRGVDTYWANEPLRTAINQRHTLFAEGGDANLRYSVSFNHGLNKGVMQGSDRQTTGGNVRLLYRRGKFSVNNSLSIDNVVSNKEPTRFSEYSRSNPYHRKYDIDGNVNLVLEDFSQIGLSTDPIYSPLHDQENLNINQQGSHGFTNNFEMEWRVLPAFRARARFGLRHANTTDEIFRSPFNTEFINTDVLERGRYQESNGKNLTYDGDFSLTYGKVFAEKHTLNAVVGTRMEQVTKRQSAFQVRGFIDDEFANPNFALSYPEGQRADYTESKRRGASFFMNTGYAYDQRYLLDATLRSDGSSVYGSEKQFSTIWSVGLAWNAHNEELVRSWKWVNQLRVRGSIGNPGNQNFDDYISMRIYRYNNENRNPFGASTIISNMGNRGLQWQTTLDRNIGLDFATFENRLRFNLDYFVKSTDPLLVFVTLPSSTGVKQVAQNMGAQVTRGFTLSTNFTLVKRRELSWQLNLNMRQLKAEYQKLGKELNNFNEANQSRNLVRYYDGGSPSDLWAVRSLGIDPTTGRELFLNSNNQQTFVHNFKDERVVGNSEPSLEGVIGNTFYYKGFTASAFIRYRIGGQAFMQTLYEKVENITTRSIAFNQDKRALYDRWKAPGDNAKFKAISRTEQTPMSSRFVADNNVLLGESFSLGYESTTVSWLRSIRASSVTFRAYMNDIFHISTIKNERGLDYPFARSVSFSAAVRF